MEIGAAKVTAEGAHAAPHTDVRARGAWPRQAHMRVRPRPRRARLARILTQSTHGAWTDGPWGLLWTDQAFSVQFLAVHHGSDTFRR